MNIMFPVLGWGFLRVRFFAFGSDDWVVFWGVFM